MDEKNLLKAIEALGAALSAKDTEIVILKYDIETLKSKIETAEKIIKDAEDKK